MSEFPVAYNASSKVVTVMVTGADRPEGAVDLGSFSFEKERGAVARFSKVLFHYVQELLVKQGEQNMQSVTIQVDPAVYDELNSEPVEAAVEGKGAITPANQKLAGSPLDGDSDVPETERGAQHEYPSIEKGNQPSVNQTSRQNPENSTQRDAVLDEQAERDRDEASNQEEDKQD